MVFTSPEEIRPSFLPRPTLPKISSEAHMGCGGSCATNAISKFWGGSEVGWSLSRRDFGRLLSIYSLLGNLQRRNLQSLTPPTVQADCGSVAIGANVTGNELPHASAKATEAAPEAAEAATAAPHAA